RHLRCSADQCCRRLERGHRLQRDHDRHVHVDEVEIAPFATSPPKFHPRIGFSPCYTAVSSPHEGDSATSGAPHPYRAAGRTFGSGSSGGSAAGLLSSRCRASVIARSNCGSSSRKIWPGSWITSISGSTPRFSTPQP